MEVKIFFIDEDVITTSGAPQLQQQWILILLWICPWRALAAVF
jgi:hypothetical protein